MDKKLLKAYDVIKLEAGMKVYTNIPEKFVYSNRRASNKLTSHDVRLGEVYGNTTDLAKVKKKIIEGIQESFSREIGIEVPVEKAEKFVTPILTEYTPEKFDTSTLIGEYIVKETSMTGGGYAQANDYYPDGHLVRCKKLNDGKFDADGAEVWFYQSGSFTAMITPDKIQAIRQMFPSA